MVYQVHESCSEDMFFARYKKSTTHVTKQGVLSSHSQSLFGHAVLISCLSSKTLDLNEYPRDKFVHRPIPISISKFLYFHPLSAHRLQHNDQDEAKTQIKRLTDTYHPHKPYKLPSRNEPCSATSHRPLHHLNKPNWHSVHMSPGKNCRITGV
jgi:hypothetical protein